MRGLLRIAAIAVIIVMTMAGCTDRNTPQEGVVQNQLPGKSWFVEVDAPNGGVLPCLIIESRDVKAVSCGWEVAYDRKK